jgi:hypothetical protein
LVGLSGAAVALPAFGATLRVPAEFLTVQSAIDSAAPNDTVLVSDGVYRGDGNRDIDFLGIAIVVRSESGPGATTLDCEGSFDEPHRGFTLSRGEGRDAIIEGFRIVNGFAGLGPVTGTARLHPSSGGGIRCESASPTIRNCVIESCATEFTGGAIAIEVLSSPLVVDCVMRGNEADIQGGAVSIETGSEAEIRDCVITGNRAPLGGGIASSASLILVGSVVAGNHAADGGGLHAIFPTTGTITETIVWRNCAAHVGHEVYVGSSSSVTFTCSAVDSLGVDGLEGAVYAGDNVFTDPLFCSRAPCSAAPTPAGDYSVASNSPCLPENNACGVRIGPLGAACGEQVPIVETSWGALKRRFRRIDGPTGD